MLGRNLGTSCIFVISEAKGKHVFQHKKKTFEERESSKVIKRRILRGLFFNFSLKSKVIMEAIIYHLYLTLVLSS